MNGCASGRALQPGLAAGAVYEIAIDSVEFGRIAAQAAKQVIVQKVREAERAQVVEAYRRSDRRAAQRAG